MPVRYTELLEATQDVPTPFALLDVPSLDANADDLARRADGVPIRVATKSVRVREVIGRILQRPGFAGLMTYSLAESLWLVEHGFDDILLAYPTVDTVSLAALAADEEAAGAVTLMVDGIEGIDFLAAHLPARHAPIGLAIDVDCSLRIGPAHLGVRRSPVRTPADAAEIARYVAGHPDFSLRGLMFYDAQIAGVPDSSPAVRLVKKRSDAELRDRRSAVRAAVTEHADLSIVNAGGTGSLHITGTDPAITELTAGSGLFQSHLFDGYDDVQRSPAALFALSVVRRPADDIATLFAGGYIASGPPEASRQPVPTWPAGLSTLKMEGAGEVQTPVKGAAARALRIGDRVLMRHAKAGEFCERFDAVHFVEADGTHRAVPTYRGEGRNFG